MTEDEKKRVYEKINKLWKNAREDDLDATFCIDFACYVYALMKDDAKKDSYWQTACDSLTDFSKRYGGSGGTASQWAQMILLTAQQIAKGKQFIYKG